ncbi:hypothetical protein BX666DRAFT_1590291 [Dichotomocladium elegans]|nr:hypothetical protein BX666DRAFT_1590291 [Dichotomocladium elegans]
MLLSFFLFSPLLTNTAFYHHDPLCNMNSKDILTKIKSSRSRTLWCMTSCCYSKSIRKSNLREKRELWQKKKKRSIYVSLSKQKRSCRPCKLYAERQ